MEITDRITKLKEQLEADEREKLTATQSLVASIQEKDALFFAGVSSLFSHIGTTYSDKYEEAMPMVDNTWLKYGEGKYPAGHNVGQAVNYLKRYLSEGFEKSYQPDDLKKAAHFIIMELARRSNED